MTANNGHLPPLSSSFSRFLVFGRGQVHTKAPALPTLLSAEMLARFSISLLFFFFAIFPTSSSCRRLQQESLFAPTQSPLPAEPPFSSFPKYPLSANSQPFFPEYTYPPPTPPSSPKLPTFPANISSLIFPNVHTNSARRRSSAKIAAAVILPVLALLSLSLAFFLHRRRNPWSHSSSSEKARFFPPNYPSSSSDAGTSSSVSDFLYAGIIYGPDGPPGADSPGHISSPELRPLPPLYRHLRQNYGNPDERCSSEEEFYSPRGSSAGKRSDPRNEFPPAAMERCGSCSDTVSTTPSHSSSYVGSCSPPVSLHSLGRSISGTFRYMGFRPPELPPRLPRPVIHSPSNRKPLSSSTLSYPNENGSTSMSANSTVPLNNLNSPAFLAAKLRSADSFSAPPRPPPPPPPPLPRPGPWDFKQRRPSLSRPSVLVPPKPIETKSTSLHSEKKENCESVEKNEDTPRPKLKPLHWDKLGGSSDREMVWDQLKSSSFQVNEERIESLFVCNTKKETSKQSILTIPKQDNRVVLDPKKSHNIAILLRALNITEDMVCTALLEGNTERLGTELLETILRMAPTREEEHKLRESEDDTQVLLGPAERFLKALLDIPFAFKRLDAMLYISNFEFEVNYLKKSFETLELACDELRGSGMFLKLLEAVLKTGNHINVGTDRGSAKAFKLDALLKLVDVKGADGKTTLLHFVVQEMVRSEGSRPSSSTSSSSLHDELRYQKLALQAVAGLGGELSNVKKAASMDHEVLGSYVSKLASGVSKISYVLRLNEELSPRDGSKQSFHESMVGFMKKAEDDIIRIQAQESVALSLVKEITEYFHGNSNREEAHPFRIFMVVRDFLSILDQVCKEIGRTMHCSVAISTRCLRATVGPTLPSVSPRLRALRPESSDDENSVSSSSA